MTQPSSQQPRRPRTIIAVAIGAVFALCLCVIAISLLLPHESARTMTPSGPVGVWDTVETIATVTPLPQATATSTQTPLPSPIDTPTPTPVVVAPTAPPAVSVPAGAVAAQLASVTDGDTISITVDGKPEKVRYIGMDTPERGEPGYKAATEANKALLGGDLLYLTTDTSERDRYGRLLCYVYTADGVMVNAEMIAQGWAQPLEFPPDTRYADEFRALASEAADARRGFWSGAGSDEAMPYALTTDSADIYAGPSAAFEVNATMLARTPLTVYGRTPDGDWLQVRASNRGGGWIAADVMKLNVAVDQIPVVGDIPVTPATPSAADGAVQIVHLNGASGEESVVIQNLNEESVDLSGWSVQSYGGSTCQPMPNQVYTFPDGFQLSAGASVRVLSGPDALSASPDDLLWITENIWNNSGDRADLRDANGLTVSTNTYGVCR